ncbi:SpoIIE family protein phosphatase [Saprospira sp. CCB-QB6]|uniref:ATP-binding SpoIIE family protein phosphatase n=1 Tax=Saprospira sp. CCB-QB6 TaxID=3023936 RepID=UPI00234B3DB8|nr:SpoIIE family protein phosphatase [Saprospira sp. CCB-QB6]WCL80754.1 SpoIIE family protein phosphatase [Saprospira sp. CCB-QB6]
MFLHTSHIRIQAIEDIYHFRHKIFSVAELLTVDAITVTTLSNSISSYLRKLPYPQEVEVQLKGDGEKITLSVQVQRSAKEERLLAAFFDEIQPTNNSSELLLVKHFRLREDFEDKFRAASNILDLKTKEELAQELLESSENLRKATLAKARMENELNVARDIQLSMLPLSFPAFPNKDEIEVFAQLIPAREVGGDFYDFYFLDDRHLAIVVGDVSGKGVPAALMMAVCKTLLKSRASTEQSTASILTYVNTEMAKDNPKSMFVTLFMGILDVQTGQFTYSNAGHNPTYIRRANGELERLSKLHGPVLAAMEGLVYRESTIELKTDDLVFAYTDGITEAHNEANELFSDDRLQQLLQQYPDEQAQPTVERIVQATQIFKGEREQFDDITAIALSFLGKGQAVATYDKEFCIKNEISEVQRAMIIFEEFAHEHRIPMPVMLKVNIVLDELLSNIIKYGFEDEDRLQLIDIKIELQAGKLLLEISDRGLPFNPFQKTPPDLSKSIEEREIGGLGIHLVRKLMDEHSYKRKIDQNVVLMIKYNIFE